MLRAGMGGRVAVDVAEIPKLAGGDPLPAASAEAEAQVNHLELQSAPLGPMGHPVGVARHRRSQ
jgi:hypothetical protein